MALASTSAQSNRRRSQTATKATREASLPASANNRVSLQMIVAGAR